MAPLLAGCAGRFAEGSADRRRKGMDGVPDAEGPFGRRVRAVRVREAVDALEREPLAAVAAYVACDLERSVLVLGDGDPRKGFAIALHGLHQTTKSCGSPLVPA